MPWTSLRRWAARLKAELFVLWFATRDPDCPPRLRWLTLALLAYALSPIDLIPDFIPVLGWLDDLVLLPLGLAFVLRRLPPAVKARAQARAQACGAAPWMGRAQQLAGAARWGLALLGLALLVLLLGLALLAWLLIRLMPGSAPG